MYDVGWIYNLGVQHAYILYSRVESTLQQSRVAIPRERARTLIQIDLQKKSRLACVGALP